MKKLLFLMLLISSNVYAGISVCYDQNDVVSNFSLRGNQIQGCDFYTEFDGNFEAVKTLLKNVPSKYIKKLGNNPVEMSPAEKVAVDDALALEITNNLKTQAKNHVTAESPEAKAMRNAFRVVMASLVETRQKVNELVTAHNQAHGTSITALPNRTWAQILSATRAQIDAETNANA